MTVLVRSCLGSPRWILFFLIVCSPSVVGASDLSFSECLTIMTANNGAILAAREEEHQYEAEQAAARGLHLPRVAIDATYTRLDEPIEVDMERFREDLLNLKLFDVIPILSPGALPSLNLMLQDDEFTVAMLTPTWPVFTGGRILSANRAARARLEASREQRRTTTYHLTSELATLAEKSYNELMKALEQFEALEASLALAKENLRLRVSCFTSLRCRTVASDGREHLHGKPKRRPG